VWNRLRRFGWSADELDGQLRVPDGASFLRVRHAHTRESPALVRNLAGHTLPVTACAVTPDGRHVVSASTDKTLKVWELATGRALATLECHTDVVTTCAVTPDGRHVVSASWDRTLEVWEPLSGHFFVAISAACKHCSEMQRVTPGSGRDRLLGRRAPAAAGDAKLQARKRARQKVDYSRISP